MTQNDHQTADRESPGVALPLHTLPPRVKPSNDERTVHPAEVDVSTTPLVGRKSKEESKPRQISIRTNNWWLLELSSWLTSATVFGVICIILRKYEGRPLPEWPWNITINAFISVMAAILKFTLLVPLTASLGQLKWCRYKRPRPMSDMQALDNASRGPFGALVWLITTLPTSLTSFGALLIVLTVAIEPFIQQVVSFPQQLIPLDYHRAGFQVPKVPSSQAYASHLIKDNNPTPSMEMQYAILRGLYLDESDDNSSLQVSPYCPTGNCTWQNADSYSSMAMCSSCVDLTSSLKYDQCENTTGWTTERICNYTLPGGLTLPLKPMPIAEEPTMGLPTMAVAIGKPATLNTTSSTVLTMQVINSTAKHPQKNFHMTNVTAAECAMFACVNNYTASFHGTTFDEILTSTWSNTSYNQCPGGFNIWLLPYEDPTSVVKHPADNQQAYIFNKQVKFSLQSYFETIFSGFAIDKPPYVTATTEELLTLLSMGDVPRTWTNIARSITKAMRESKAPADTSVPAAGTARVSEPRVRVQWAYLLLPAVLEVLALVFTGLNIAKSRAGGWRV